MGQTPSPLVGFLDKSVSSNHARGPSCCGLRARGTGQGPWVFKDTPHLVPSLSSLEGSLCEQLWIQEIHHPGSGEAEVELSSGPHSHWEALGRKSTPKLVLVHGTIRFHAATGLRSWFPPRVGEGHSQLYGTTTSLAMQPTIFMPATRNPSPALNSDWGHAAGFPGSSVQAVDRGTSQPP